MLDCIPGCYQFIKEFKIFVIGLKVTIKLKTNNIKYLWNVEETPKGFGSMLTEKNMESSCSWVASE